MAGRHAVLFIHVRVVCRYEDNALPNVIIKLIPLHASNPGRKYTLHTVMLIIDLRG